MSVAFLKEESAEAASETVRIARMRARTVILNTSRGGLIDEAALEAALHSGHIAGAGIDVFATEPPTVSENQLFSAPNVVLTRPHRPCTRKKASPNCRRRLPVKSRGSLPDGRRSTGSNRWD